MSQLHHIKIEIPYKGEYFAYTIGRSMRNWRDWGFSKREIVSLGKYNGCENYEIACNLPMANLKKIITHYLNLCTVPDFKFKYQGTYDETRQLEAVERVAYDMGVWS